MVQYFTEGKSPLIFVKAVCNTLVGSAGCLFIYILLFFINSSASFGFFLTIFINSLIRTYSSSYALIFLPFRAVLISFVVPIGLPAPSRFPPLPHFSPRKPNKPI